MANGLQQASADVKKESDLLASMTQSAGSLPDMLQSALTSKFSREDPLFQQRESALQDFLTAGDVARTEFSPQQANVVLSPTQQRQLVSQRQAGAVAPLSSLNTLIGARFGGIGNVVDAATRAFNAQVQAQSLRQQAAQQQFANQIDLEKLRQSAAKAAGGGLSFSNLLSLGRALKPNATQQMASDNATSGLSAIAGMRDLLARKKNISKTSKVPLLGRLGADNQTFRLYSREAQDVLTRLRTGAALNAQEIAFYEQNLPDFFDTKATVDAKLDNLENLLTSVQARGQFGGGEGGELLDFLSGMGAFGDVETGGDTTGGEWELVF